MPKRPQAPTLQIGRSRSKLLRRLGRPIRLRCIPYGFLTSAGPQGTAERHDLFESPLGVHPRERVVRVVHEGRVLGGVDGHDPQPPTSLSFVSSLARLVDTLHSLHLLDIQGVTKVVPPDV